MKLLLSHIADLDGITPIILLKLLNIDFDYQLFEVGQINDYLNEKIDNNQLDSYDEIFITDLSVSKSIADKIMMSKYNNKIKLFDHHKSAEWLNNYDFANVCESINGFMECGTTLFYKYLVNTFESKILTKESVITFVELVREGDTWQFTDLKNDSDNLNALFNFYGIEDSIDKFTDFLYHNQSFYFDSTELEIIKCLNRKQTNYLKYMEDKVLFKRIDNYDIGIVFAEQYRSSLGHHLAQIYQDKVDFIAIINLNRHVSFRGIKDIDISLFAKKFGGGGHPKACAIPLPNFLKDIIIKEIFNDNR